MPEPHEPEIRTTDVPQTSGRDPGGVTGTGGSDDGAEPDGRAAAGRSWYLAVLALAVCPASKLLIFAAGATVLGVVATGALAVAVSGALVGIYFWVRRRRFRHLPAQSACNRQAMRRTGTVE